MSIPVRDTSAMIAGMAPVPDPETWYFCTLPGPVEARALARFEEGEGVSLILPEDEVHRLGLPADLPMRRITLSVHSALDGVGLTAAVAGVLAENGIACNMVAAYHHDHVFVPAAQAERALELLCRLSGGSAP